MDSICSILKTHFEHVTEVQSVKSILFSLLAGPYSELESKNPPVLSPQTQIKLNVLTHFFPPTTFCGTELRPEKKK